MAWACRRCQRVFAELPQDETCPHDGGTLVEVTEHSLTDEHTGRVCDDKYQIGNVIGAGGMGCVHEAVNLRLDQKVAVKFFSPRFICSTGRDAAQAAERFRREATVMAKARHPNVVHVLDFSIEFDGTMYIVMEMLEGRPLDEVMEQGSLTVKEALTSIATVLKALEYVHSQGVIHRDLKPSNIFCATVAGKQTIKVLDFGIARIADSTTITQGPVGTWRYAAPEQLAGEEVRPSADIYSVGVILGELLTGKVSGHDNLGDEQPDELRELIARATAQAPDERYSEASAMSADLIKAMSSISKEKLGATLPKFRKELSCDSTSAPRKETQNRDNAPAPTPVLDRRKNPASDASAPSSKRWLIIAIVLFVALLATGALYLSSSNSQQPATPPRAQEGGPDLAASSSSSDASSASDGSNDASADQTVTVTFVSTPRGAKVFRTGPGEEEVELCQSNCISELELSKAEVEIAFRAEGFEEHRERFAPDQDRLIEVTLSKTSSPRVGTSKTPPRPPRKGTKVPSPRELVPTKSGATGFLSVRAIPQSDIYLDGRKIGRSPIARHAVPTGRHSLKLVPRPEALGPGVERPPRVVSIVIEEGQTKSVVEYW